MTQVNVPLTILNRTLATLRAGGVVGHERVVLWLGATSAGGRVLEAYEPEQVTAKDRFYLPPHSMRQLMSHLRSKRLKIVAQIHTHPGHAFHSEADAEWAIVRHVGALSLVLPRFAATTTAETFLDEVMTYAFTPEADWALTPNRGPGAKLELV
ncbi:hypothetical protein [Caulobacter sp.]|uniref:hypothetical protein n=1 Tax=Caulobacter sp. TaxID=78 RepID=UPI003BAD2E60